LGTVLFIAIVWICRVVTVKTNPVDVLRTPQTHMIRRCAVKDLQPASS